MDRLKQKVVDFEYQSWMPQSVNKHILGRKEHRRIFKKIPIVYESVFAQQDEIVGLVLVGRQRYASMVNRPSGSRSSLVEWPSVY